jgi:hypothetical protein
MGVHSSKDVTARDEVGQSLPLRKTDLASSFAELRLDEFQSKRVIDVLFCAGSHQFPSAEESVGFKLTAFFLQQISAAAPNESSNPLRTIALHLPGCSSPRK